MLDVTKLRVAAWLSSHNFKGVNATDAIRGWFAAMPRSVQKGKKMVPWCPPPMGLLKMNFNGIVSRQSEIAGYGVVVMTPESEVVSYPSPVLVCLSNEVEAMGLWIGKARSERKHSGGGIFCGYPVGKMQQLSMEIAG